MRVNPDIAQNPECERTEVLKTAELEKAPVWALLFMPSLADVFFLVTFWFLTFGFWGQRLLSDADTGWHIRNGQHILATHAVPHSDYMSYTMAGRPWYSWEWLYDIVLALTHKVAGLNGVVVLSAFMIAVTFTLLFRLSSKRGGNLVIAAALTLLCIAAGSIHFLARPHLVTWLFVLVWFAVLDRFHFDGNWKRLAVLPPLMLVWVNLHGGFLLGLVLPVIFAAAGAWTALVISVPSERAQHLKKANQLLLATLITFTVTLVNPYGWKLYVHLHDYLGSRFMMDNISEFLSPNFHLLQPKLFVGLLLLTLVALALTPRPKPLDIILVCFSGYAGLYAARNIPTASMLLALTAAPLLTWTVSNTADDESLSVGVRHSAFWLQTFSARMSALESQLRIHAIPILLVLATIAISIHGGRAISHQVLDLKFNDKQMPVGAADYIASHDIRNAVFAEDAWGGYLIYRLYPSFLVFVDDRHDFYGEDFLREYMEAVRLGPNWRGVLDKHFVNFVLVSPDSQLAWALRASSDWKPVFSDTASVMFARIRPVELPALILK